MGKTSAEMVRESLELVEVSTSVFAEDFYDLLFLRAPATRALFSDDSEAQGQKLIHTLLQALRAYDKPGELVGSLKRLGNMHAQKGITNKDFEVFLDAFSECMLGQLGDRWTSEHEVALSETLRFIWKVMMSGVDSNS